MKEVLTAQAVFDNVVAALAAQGGPSRADLPDTAGGGCAYRGDYGRKCAVGHLIRDDEYEPSMENQSVEGLLDRHLLPDRLIPFAGLLGSLQDAHDRADYDTGFRWSDVWGFDEGAFESLPFGIAARLVKVANKHGLDIDAVMRAFPTLGPVEGEQTAAAWA